MMNTIAKANGAMVLSKVFGGLNVNALRYLLPLWVAPLTGVTFRCVFAAVAFWIIGCWAKPETSSTRDKIALFLMGAIGMYGYMFSYLMGLSRTTPVSAAIFYVDATDMGFYHVGSFLSGENYSDEGVGYCHRPVGSIVVHRHTGEQRFGNRCLYR